MNQLPNLNLRLIAADLMFHRAKRMLDSPPLFDEQARRELQEAVALYSAALPIAEEQEAVGHDA